MFCINQMDCRNKIKKNVMICGEMSSCLHTIKLDFIMDEKEIARDYCILNKSDIVIIRSKKKCGRLKGIVRNRVFESVSRRISLKNETRGFQCCGCGNVTTPYWRDSWSCNLMLCNKCGLRYEKYGRYCFKCFFVPKKSGVKKKECPRCMLKW